MFKPKPDILFRAVENKDLDLIKQILNKHKSDMDRVKAYDYAIDNNLLEIAHTIRKSYIYD